MNSEQEARLQALLQRLVRVRGAQKDPRAETLIRQALERQPDAAYLLTQRVLVLEGALEETREQMARVQSTPFSPPISARDDRPRRLSRIKHAAAAGMAAGVFLLQGVDAPAGGMRIGGGGGSGPETVVELALDGENPRNSEGSRQAAGEALIYLDGYAAAGDDEGADLT